MYLALVHGQNLLYALAQYKNDYGRTTLSSLILRLIPAASCLAAFGFSTTVAAGGSVTVVGSLTYGPGSSSVPTLGGGGLIVLALLLAVTAFRVMHAQQHKSVNLVVALAAVAAIASGASGIKLVSDAQAVEIPEPGVILLGSVSGGTEPLIIGLNLILNETTAPQKILGIQLNEGCDTGPIGDAPATACYDNPPTTLAPEAACALRINCGGQDWL